MSNCDFIPADPQPLGVICRNNALRYPERPAITTRGGIISWSMLDANAARVANGLAKKGVECGHRVAVLGRNTAKMFDVLHGLAWLGAIFVPINWRLAPPEIAYILRDSDAETLFVTREFWKILSERPEIIAPLKNVILFDGTEADDAIVYDAWLDAQSPRNERVDVATVNTAIQLYTSGTTGHPKGALLSGDYLIGMARMASLQEEEIFGLKPGEEPLHYVPMFHLSGIAYHYHAAVRGQGVILLDEFEPLEILSLSKKHNSPWIYGVPSMLQSLLEASEEEHTDTSHFRYCSYGSAPMPPALRDRLMEAFGCRFAQFYGMTESALVTCLYPDDHLGDAARLGSVGRPMPGVEIKIVGPDGKEVPRGTVGQIAVRSPVMMSGYWKLPKATEEAFKDGWYLSGDGGYLDDEGYLYLKDRIRDIIISGGENIYPAEIENVLYQLTAVQHAAVVGVPDEYWGEVPKAFVVLRPGSDISLDDIRAHAQANLGRYKLPKQYEIIDEMPFNASGKIMKHVLRGAAQ